MHKPFGSQCTEKKTSIVAGGRRQTGLRQIMLQRDSDFLACHWHCHLIKQCRAAAKGSYSPLPRERERNEWAFPGCSSSRLSLKGLHQLLSLICQQCAVINWWVAHFCAPYIRHGSAPPSVLTGLRDQNVPHHGPCQGWINVPQWTQAKTT